LCFGANLRLLTKKQNNNNSTANSDHSTSLYKQGWKDKMKGGRGQGEIVSFKSKKLHTIVARIRMTISGHSNN